MAKHTYSTNLKGAAFVCSHIMDSGLPILVARLDERVDEADTGWQFLCNSGQPEDEPRVWSLAEVLRFEPSLVSFIDHPIGTILQRIDKNGPWRLVKD